MFLLFRGGVELLPGVLFTDEMHVLVGHRWLQLPGNGKVEGFLM